MADHVERVLGQWAAERPALDVSPMAVIGRVKRLHRFAEAATRRTFAAHGLDHASFDVLATLLRGGAPYRLTPAALMRDAMVTSGAITQRLDRLEERGLVSRAPSPEDGRGVLVSLTEAGRALVDETLPDHLATEEGLLAGLDPAGRAALAEALGHLLDSLENRH
ncbi:MarR family winged helix-turn-helix transcriptional regulator [Streptomyces sp. NPDC088923]|uniref:MarR family winged helix-turn-helix transcriptional regulator n=1 Tax=Streptomyces sp. NPDC088923 TaxID=3365913 RepID=UPI00381CF898